VLSLIQKTVASITRQKPKHKGPHLRRPPPPPAPCSQRPVAQRGDLKRTARAIADAQGWTGSLDSLDALCIRYSEYYWSQPVPAQAPRRGVVVAAVVVYFFIWRVVFLDEVPDNHSLSGK